MLFGENVVGSDNLVISSYMVPLLTSSGNYDVISKKLKKLSISWFSVSEWFFRSKNVLIVISSKMLQNDVSRDHFLNMTLKIPNFTTIFEILSELPVQRSVDHKINIFQISVKNASIWGITSTIYLWFSLPHYDSKRCKNVFDRITWLINR